MPSLCGCDHTERRGRIELQVFIRRGSVSNEISNYDSLYSNSPLSNQSQTGAANQATTAGEDAAARQPDASGHPATANQSANDSELSGSVISTAGLTSFATLSASFAGQAISPSKLLNAASILSTNLTGALDQKATTDTGGPTDQLSFKSTSTITSQDSGIQTDTSGTEPSSTKTSFNLANNASVAANTTSSTNQSSVNTSGGSNVKSFSTITSDGKTVSVNTINLNTSKVFIGNLIAEEILIDRIFLPGTGRLCQASPQPDSNGSERLERPVREN